MITTILIATAVLYFIQMILLRIGLKKSNNVSIVTGYEPSVSVIVAARNEEQHIENCLQSLSHLDYPTGKLEIIVVNDCSTDRTAEAVENFIKTHSGVKSITITPGTGNLRGKTNAVARGIGVSRGEILMFTDADCMVPASWIRETLKYFDKDIGIVGGFTLLNASNNFKGMQSLDWIFLFGLASAMAGWNKPLTVIGNNLSVRRCAYEATGGYEHISFSVTEDYALVQAILRRTNFKINFPADPHTAVQSKACQNLKQLYRQKQRWGVGGLNMVFRGMVIMSIGWLLRSVLLATIFFFDPSPVFVIAPFMMLIDLAFLWNTVKRLRAIPLLKFLFSFEVYNLRYVPLIPLVALLSKNIVWKERRL